MTPSRWRWSPPPPAVAAALALDGVETSVSAVCGEKDWSHSSDREADKLLLPVPQAGHVIALERLNAVA